MDKKTLIHSKLNNQRGVTAVDIVVSITMIILAISIVMAIYVNINLSSREVTRKAAATRLATNMLERIDIMYYDQVSKQFSDLTGTTYTSYVEFTDGEGFDPNGIYKVSGLPANTKIFNTKIPTGYTVIFDVSNVYGESDGTKYDLVKNIKITVEFPVGKRTEEVSLATTKEFIKLNQIANEPVFDSEYFVQVTRLAEDIPSQFLFNSSLYGSGEYAFVYKETGGDFVKSDTPVYAYTESVSSVNPCAICIDPNANIEGNKVINSDYVYVWIPAHYISDDDPTKIIYRYKDTPNEIKNMSLTDLDGLNTINIYTPNSSTSTFQRYEDMQNVIVNGDLIYDCELLNLPAAFREKTGVWVNPNRMDEMISEEGIYEEYFNKFWDAINY